MIEVTDQAYGPVSQRGEPVQLPAGAAPYARSGIFPGRPGSDRRRRGSELIGRDQDLAVLGAFVDETAAAGAEFEDVSFSGLNQILLPLRAELARLDDVQQYALNVALGFSGGLTCDRLVVANAALALLSQAAARTTGSGTIDLGLSGYDLPPLDEEAATRLVATRFPDLAYAVRQRIVTEA